MKKTLFTCLAVLAVFAIASSAAAVTCTIDQRPGCDAARPVLPGQLRSRTATPITTGVGARDTIVTIMNASSAPMIAHVDVYDRQTIIRLDFDIALTGFDVQPMRMSDILSGFLPVTSNGDRRRRVPAQPVGDGLPGLGRLPPRASRCPRPPAWTTRRRRPSTRSRRSTSTSPSQLREDCDGDLDALAIGYMVIDHANYCNLSNPSDPVYYENDAIGMENNLWGEIIFTSGLGIPTYAMSTVNLEADAAFGDAAELDPFTPVRTFYARYWDPFTEAVLHELRLGRPRDRPLDQRSLGCRLRRPA